MSDLNELTKELLSLKAELGELRHQLQESNDIIEAIRSGSIDAIAVGGATGPEIYTLKSADHTYRILVENMNEGAVLLNRRGEIIYCNSSFADFVQRSINSIIGSAFSSFIPTTFVENFTRLFDEGWTSSSKGEFMLPRDINGAWRAFSFSFNSMEADNLLSLIITDISSTFEIESIRNQVKIQNQIIEEKNLQLEKEEETKSELERIKYILEGIPQITWTNSPSGDINFYNSRWYEYTGKTIEENNIENWVEVLHPDDYENTIHAFNNSLNTGIFFEIESRFKRHTDQSYRWHLNRALPIKTEDGQVTLWVGTATDIEEQKQSEDKFRFLAETVPQIFWTANPDGGVDYFNQQWYQYTGLNVNQSEDWGWEVVLHPEDFDRSIAVWKKSIQDGSEYKIEYRFKRDSDQSYRWHLGRALPLRNNVGEIIKWFGTCSDIHDQIEAMNKLALAKDDLQKSNSDLNNKNIELQKINNDLDNFIYTASHDLKAPVSNIEGLILALHESLLSEGLKNKETELLIELINKSIERFKSTILDLTEISKIQNGDGADVEEINVCEVIDDVMSDMKDVIRKADSSITIQASVCPVITFSRKNFKSIVYNLLSNAIKYRSSTNDSQVLIQTDQVENFVVLIFEDNGLGMDLNKSNKLFSMFKRFHDHVEGTGIGLYLVKRIIDNAGGKIEVESQVGKGSIFRIYFKASNS